MVHVPGCIATPPPVSIEPNPHHVDSPFLDRFCFCVPECSRCIRETTRTAWVCPSLEHLHSLWGSIVFCLRNPERCCEADGTEGTENVEKFHHVADCSTKSHKYNHNKVMKLILPLQSLLSPSPSPFLRRIDTDKHGLDG